MNGSKIHELVLIIEVNLNRGNSIFKNNKRYGYRSFPIAIAIGWAAGGVRIGNHDRELTDQIV